MSGTKTTDSAFNIPLESYGVLLRDEPDSLLDEVAEQVRRIGYAVLDSEFSTDFIFSFAETFDRTRFNYLQKWGEQRLRAAGELHTIRAPLTQENDYFIKLATADNLIKVLRKLIRGKFILNQQNGVINPPGETYGQGAWHRDLPYQHFLSSTPIAINALYCVDDFTVNNGATFVLPASHKTENFPSLCYLNRNAIQIEAKAGQFILLDCMIYHAGGFNRTPEERRAVNHVFTIPYFKQQIKLSDIMKDNKLTNAEQELFGFQFQEPTSIEQYLNQRMR